MVALSKKGGGVRPIAVGNVWRRLASKCAISSVLDQIKPMLYPLQLGVGVHGGAEAAIHSVRRLIHNLPINWCFLKIDFQNAFNTIRRDAMLEAVKQHCPGIYNYCLTAYGQTTSLSYQNHMIDSCEGVQQGDPLGPLLFAITIHPLLTQMSSVFKCGYLDDISMSSDIDALTADFAALKYEASLLGLLLNTKKCEIFANDPTFVQNHLALAEVPCKPLSSLSFLGAPIMPGITVQNFLQARLEELIYALNRSSELTLHDSLSIIRQALYVPKLMYCLRTSQIDDVLLLHEFDANLRNSLSSICNIEISDAGWLQAQLPVRHGGLGLSNVVQLAPLAYQSSAAATFDLQMALLSEFYRSQGSLVPPTTPEFFSQQRSLDALFQNSYQSLVSNCDSPFDKARLLAVTSQASCGWLRTWPNTSLGTRLDDETVRTSLALRLGLRVHKEYRCKCGELASERGYHGLACRLGGSRQLRHSVVNDYICRLFSKASVPVAKEPTGTSSADGKRPDGCTLIPWKSGRCLAWDVTIPDTVAARYISLTCQQSGTAATRASDEKFKKYSGALGSMHFVPICIEAFGPMDPVTSGFFIEICGWISKRSGDQREHIFAINYISCILQRMNYVCIRENITMNTDQCK